MDLRRSAQPKAHGYNAPNDETAIRGLLAAAGLKVTRQRIALTRLLFGSEDRHVSAEQLYAALTEAGAPGSISSVYRALRDFTDVGLLRRVPIYGSVAYFDTQIRHHHHVYAEDEDLLIDLPPEDVSLAKLPSPPDGYELVSVDVVMRVRRRGFSDSKHIEGNASEQGS